MAPKTSSTFNRLAGIKFRNEVPSPGGRSSRPRSVAPVFGVGLAVALVGAAWIATVQLQNVVSTNGFVFFYTAVVVTTWFGGRWGGALAVILATMTVAYDFMPPIHSLRMDRESVPLFVEFAASSAVVGWFSSWRKQAEHALTQARDELQLRVEERTAELRQTNEQLLAEIAERKRAEDAYYGAQAELARVTRISSLGALAASISHEVNQPLAAVVTNADACMMWLSGDNPNLDEARAAVDSIAREGTRASDVVRRIRAMFTSAAQERTLLDLNGLLRETASLMEPQAARNDIKLQLELADSLPRVAGDRVQLQQVLVNLISNGIDAMHDMTARPRRLVVRSEMRDPDDVLVAVRDEGAGIDPKNQRRIFDALFTTKPQGMGMGLNISRSIVEAHGGRLWATPNSDVGTTFRFSLPASVDRAV